MKKSFDIPVELKQLITSNQAFHYRIIPVKKDNDKLVLKTDQKNLSSLTKTLEVVLDFEIVLEEETEENLQAYLSLNYRKVTKETGPLTKNRFLEELLQTASDFDSSDIHLEPFDDVCQARIRLDGKLKEIHQIAKEDYVWIVNQVKVMAELDIAQKRISQDGRITVKNEINNYDIRVSTLPTLHGEKIVLRILKQDTSSVDLKKLGFSEKELEVYLQGIKMPNGIILISGPTGSGKTTTLYGTLKLLNREETNVVTIEDPIEYTLRGINQVQLKEDIGFDFPTALRTFLRQDPDVIMVGEIRDEKTANMAIKASLTGHLVLSTIHTNSAWATISRLIDMGVPPYLLATTLNLSVAQRLVRKLCVHCKKEAKVHVELFPKNFMEIKDINVHFVPVGCEHCYGTGYHGRIAIYEIIPITQQLQLAIKRNELQIDDYLDENNINTLKSNAIRLINSGETSVDEVYSLLAN